LAEQSAEPANRSVPIWRKALLSSACRRLSSSGS
jgi:hypothetical protein